MQPTLVQLVAALCFLLALIHTFATDYFEHLAHTQPRHAGVWHLLAEVEVVFGFWAFVLLLAMALIEGPTPAIDYLESRRFDEPLFVFAIMVIAGTRPIIAAAASITRSLARIIPVARPVAFYSLALSLIPLAGSFITEPAAMTLAALMLRDRAFGPGTSTRLKYATLGVLFVNVSIGGTLTPFAAPPVLMVAQTWDWDLAFMLQHFGWRAALAVVVNALAVTILMRRELKTLAEPADEARERPPFAVTAAHIVFLVGLVIFAHHPTVFIGLLLLFLGFTTAYEKHQDRLLLREGLLVGFFLAGLVVLGGQQEWWLRSVITGASPGVLYFGATALTAVTDNAALTYLGSQVSGLSDAVKYALVAGAVTGGGLTVIANAPNPAGFSILKSRFDEGAINPGGLLLAALIPTCVAIIAFWIL